MEDFSMHWAWCSLLVLGKLLPFTSLLVCLIEGAELLIKVSKSTSIKLEIVNGSLHCYSGELFSSATENISDRLPHHC